MKLDAKQIRLLELLETQISECKGCPNLRRNGQCLPYWTPFSEYLIIGEAPGRDEVNSEPFIGVTGKKLWELMFDLGLRKENFAIINTVQCRPMAGKKNGKPTKKNCERCYPWIRKFVKIIQPEKGILFGNYAKASFYDGEPSGILRYNSQRRSLCFDDYEVDIILSVHPSMMIYKGDDGVSLISKSIKEFKMI